MTPPLGTLEYLYVGTADFDRDCAYYANVLGAERDRFADPSGNPYALFQNDRPEAMGRAYADKDNANAIRG